MLDDLGYPDHGRYTRVANDFGVTYGSTKKWLKGISMPDRHRMESVSKFYGVNNEWLSTGKGEKFSGDYSTIQKLQSAMDGLTDCEKKEALEQYLGTLERTEAIKIVGAFLAGISADPSGPSGPSDDQSAY